MTPFPHPQYPTGRPGVPWTGGVNFFRGPYAPYYAYTNGTLLYLPSYYVSWNTGGYFQGNSGYFPGNFGNFVPGFPGDAAPNAGQAYPPVGLVPRSDSPARGRVEVDVTDPAPGVVPRSTGRRTTPPDDYYLTRLMRKPEALRRDPSLAEAVTEIETAFLRSDVSLLGRHVLASEPLGVQTGGRTRERLSSTAYLQATREAMEAMRTARYTLDRVEPATDGYLVSGTHVLRTEGGTEQSFAVGFLLRKSENRWIITEISAEPVR
jgi:hypothetical protein